MTESGPADTRPPQSKPPGRGAPRGADYTQGSVGRHLIRLAGFMVMGFLSMNIAQLIEAIYLGLVGVEDLAALGFAFPLIMGVGAMARGLGIGASSVIARTMGAGDRAQVARLATHCEFLVVLFAALCIVAGLAFGQSLFAFMGAEDRVLELATGYLHVYLIGLPFFLLSMVGTSLLRATGSPASPGIVMTLGSVLQIVVSPFFIFGWLGLPAMGVVGAAWGFVVARGMSFILAFYFIAIRDRLILVSLANALPAWKAILHVGGPAMATNMLLPISAGIITWLLAGHGIAVIAGYNVAGRIDMMLTMVLISVSGSIGPFVGQNWGAGHYDRARHAISLCIRFCMAWGIAGFLLMWLGAEFLVGLISDDTAVVQTAVDYLLIISLSIGFMGWLQVCSSVFNALGRPLPPLVLSVMRGLVVYVPLAMLGSRWLGYTGVFWATAVTNVVLGIVAWRWCMVVLARESAIQETTANTISGG